MQPLRSQATDWTLDFSNNRAGAIYGQGMERFGSMVGNAIAEYAKEKKEKEKKKKEEEAAAQFLTQQGYFKTPEEAKVAVRGMGGPDKVTQFMRLDQEKKLMEERAAALAQEKAAAEAKAAALERENAIVRNTVLGGAAPGQPPPFLARSGTPAADMSANGFARNMVMQGMPGAQALKYGEQIAGSMPKQDKAEPKPVEQVDPVTGRKFTTWNGQIVHTPKEDTPGTRPPFGAKDTATVNGTTYDLVFDGTRWVEAKSKQPWIAKDMYGNDAINPMFSGATSKPPPVGEDEKKPGASRFSIRRVN
jgi:hypothetical protein